jgi:hypothetical protein
MFIPYIKTLGVMIAPDIDTSEYKAYTKWVERIYERPAVKKVLALMDEAFAQAG